MFGARLEISEDPDWPERTPEYLLLDSAGDTGAASARRFRECHRPAEPEREYVLGAKVVSSTTVYATTGRSRPKGREIS